MSSMQMGRAQQLFGHVPLESTLYRQQSAPIVRATPMSRPMTASTTSTGRSTMTNSTIAAGEKHIYNVFGGCPGELEEDVGLCLKMSEVFEEMVGWME